MKTPSLNAAHPFTATTVFMCGGLLIWAADFLVVYVIAAIACAKGYASSTVLGVPFVAFVASVVTLLAVAATVWVVRVAVGQLRARGERGARFIYFLAASLGGMALLAIFFNVLPAWLLATECGR